MSFWGKVLTNKLQLALQGWHPFEPISCNPVLSLISRITLRPDIITAQPCEALVMGLVEEPGSPQKANPENCFRGLQRFFWGPRISITLRRLCANGRLAGADLQSPGCGAALIRGRASHLALQRPWGQSITSSPKPDDHQQFDGVFKALPYQVVTTLESEHGNGVPLIPLKPSLKGFPHFETDTLLKCLDVFSNPFIPAQEKETPPPKKKQSNNLWFSQCSFL